MHLHAPQRKEAYDSSQALLSLSHCDNDCSTLISSLSPSLPAYRISWLACFSQVNNTRHVMYALQIRVTSQASAMTPRLPPLPSPRSSRVPIPSHARELEQLVCGACIRPHASAVAARSVTRAKTIVRWAPATLFTSCLILYGALFAGLAGQTEVHRWHKPPRHRASRIECFGQATVGFRKNLRRACYQAVLYCYTYKRKQVHFHFGRVFLHELAANIHVCNISLHAKHAVDRRDRGKVPQIPSAGRGLVALPGCNGKGFACSCTLRTPRRKKPLGGLLAKQITGSGNGLPNRARAHTSWPAWIFLSNLLIPLLCQSQKPFCIGAPKFAKLRTTNHRRRRASDRDDDPARASEKRNIWKWKACRCTSSLNSTSLSLGRRRSHPSSSVQVSIEPWDVGFTVSPVDWKPVAFHPR